MLKFTESSTAEATALFPQAEHTALHHFTDTQPVLIVRDGDTTIGYALLQLDADHAWLRYIYIAEPYRRQALGRTLMSIVASKAVQWQQWQLLAQAPTEAVAIAFCQAIGFAPLATDATVLALDLTDPTGMRHGR